MTFFLGMNYKFSLYIFQLFPKSPPIQGKFDLKHQFTSIFTKNFPHLPSGFPDFPLIETLRNVMTFFFRENINKFSLFSSKMNKFSLPPRYHQLELYTPLIVQHSALILPSLIRKNIFINSNQ